MTVEKIDLAPSLDTIIKSCLAYRSDGCPDNNQGIIDFSESTPEIVIVLNGFIDVYYDNKFYKITKSCLFTFIDKPILAVPSSDAYVIKLSIGELGVFSLLNIARNSAKELTSTSMMLLSDILGDTESLESKLIKMENILSLEEELSRFIMKKIGNDPLQYLDKVIMTIDKTASYDSGEILNSMAS